MRANTRRQGQNDEERRRRENEYIKDNTDFIENRKNPQQDRLYLLRGWSKGISPLYLVTDHTGFYERYGREFFCMVQGDGEPGMTRMYVHR